MRVLLTVMDSHPMVYLVEVADEAELEKLVAHMEEVWDPVEIEVDTTPLTAAELMEQNPLDEDEEDEEP